MTRWDHDHRLRLAKDGLVVLTGEGLGSTLRNKSGQSLQSKEKCLFQPPKECNRLSYLYSSDVRVVICKKKQKLVRKS